jgi:hypothetical protein
VVVLGLVTAKKSTTRTREDDWGEEGLCTEAIDQATQHCYDAREHLLAGRNTIGRNQSFSDRRIEASGALQCRAAGVVEKLGALATLPFAVSFGRIEKDGEARAIELFDQLASMLARRFRSIVKKGGNPSNETEFYAIDIEFFVVKKGIH